MVEEQLLRYGVKLNKLKKNPSACFGEILQIAFLCVQEKNFHFDIYYILIGLTFEMSAMEK